MANLRRNVALPAGSACGRDRRARAACARRATGRWRSAMFGCAAFLLAGVVQEFWRGTRARRAMSSDAWPVAVVSLVRRNRRRYGGYLVHVGMATLFVGVAASSAFQQAHDMRIEPGPDRAPSAATRSPTLGRSAASRTRDGRDRADHARRACSCRQGRRARPHARAEQRLVPGRTRRSPRSAAMFDGESTSEVRMVAGLRRDVWTAVSPELGAAARRHEGLRPGDPQDGRTGGRRQAGARLPLRRSRRSSTTTPTQRPPRRSA